MNPDADSLEATRNRESKNEDLPGFAAMISWAQPRNNAFLPGALADSENFNDFRFSLVQSDLEWFQNTKFSIIMRIFLVIWT